MAQNNMGMRGHGMRVTTLALIAALLVCAPSAQAKTHIRAVTKVEHTVFRFSDGQTALMELDELTWMAQSRNHRWPLGEEPPVAPGEFVAVSARISMSHDASQVATIVDTMRVSLPPPPPVPPPPPPGTPPPPSSPPSDPEYQTTQTQALYRQQDGGEPELLLERPLDIEFGEEGFRLQISNAFQGSDATFLNTVTMVSQGDSVGFESSTVQAWRASDSPVRGLVYRPIPGRVHFGAFAHGDKLYGLDFPAGTFSEDEPPEFTIIGYDRSAGSFEVLYDDEMIINGASNDEIETSVALTISGISDPATSTPHLRVFTATGTGDIEPVPRGVASTKSMCLSTDRVFAAAGTDEITGTPTAIWSIGLDGTGTWTQVLDLIGADEGVFLGMTCHGDTATVMERTSADQAGQTFRVTRVSADEVATVFEGVLTEENAQVLNSDGGSPGGPGDSADSNGQTAELRQAGPGIFSAVVPIRPPGGGDERASGYVALVLGLQTDSVIVNEQVIVNGSGGHIEIGDVECSDQVLAVTWSGEDPANPDSLARHHGRVFYFKYAGGRAYPLQEAEDIIALKVSWNNAFDPWTWYMAYIASLSAGAAAATVLLVKRRRRVLTNGGKAESGKTTRLQPLASVSQTSLHSRSRSRSPMPRSKGQGLHHHGNGRSRSRSPMPKGKEPSRP